MPDFNFHTPGYTPPAGTELNFNFGAGAAVAALEDARLNLSASDGNCLKDIKAILMALWEQRENTGLSLRASYQQIINAGFSLKLLGYFWSDLTASLSARGGGFSDCALKLLVSKLQLQNVGLSLTAASSTILKVVVLFLSATDGAVANDFGLKLMVVPANRPKRADIYHRISSVIRRVT